MLKCYVCIEFQDKLRRMRNYSNVFIGASKNLWDSSFKDHAASDMHARAMMLLKKQSSSDVTEYTPMAKALHTIDSDAEGKLRCKYDFAFFISKENVAFAKMGVLCKLEKNLINFPECKIWNGQRKRVCQTITDECQINFSYVLTLCQNNFSMLSWVLYSKYKAWASSFVCPHVIKLSLPVTFLMW